MAKDTTDWVGHARTFIATGRKEYLQMAQEKCNDPEIVEFLGREDVAGESFVPQEIFAPLVEKLRSQGKEKEAAVVYLLGIRLPALMADSPEQLDADQYKIASSVCNQAAAISRENGFSECDAVFVKTLGTAEAKQHNWDQARGLLDHSLRIYRELAASQPQIYRPDVATTLNNLGTVFRNQREFAAARDAFEEAVKEYRELAASQPQIYRPYVATTLNNLGVVLSNQRELSAARYAYKKSLEIYRELAASQPQIYRSYVAMTLNNLGNVLSEQREFTTARDKYKEALEIRRELAASQPQIYRPDVAMTLNNLGNVLRDQREFAAARDVYKEALEIRRELAADQPQIYRPDVAMTLNNLGNVLSNQREFAAARDAYKEALEIRCELAASQPQIYRLDVAGTLNNLGNVLSDQQEFATARDAFEEALEIRRELAASQPQIYRPDVAMTLNNLGTVLRDQREFAAARDAYEEALEIRRELAASQPQIYRPDVAITLNNLGNVLSSQREFAAARDAFEEALEIYRELAADQPQIYRPNVVTILNNLGNVLEKMQKNEEALKYSLEAVAVAEEEESPDQLYLAKGNASAAYRRVLESQLTNGDSSKVFRTLAAMSEGVVCALADNQGHSLATTKEFLSKMRQEKKREVILLVARRLRDNRYALLVIHSDGMEYTVLEDGVVAELFKEVLTVFDKNDTREADVRQKNIRSLGIRIWKSLPDFVREAIDPAKGHEVLIVGDTFCNAFCWELLCFGDGENNWLGLHRSLVRYDGITAEALSRLEKRSFGNGKCQATVFCPWDIPDSEGRTLKHTEGESQLVLSRLKMLSYELLPDGKAFFGKEANHPQLIRVVRNSPSIIHYSGHGDIVGNDEVLVIWDGSQKEPAFFGRKDIALAKQLQGDGDKLFDHSPLIVLNSCMTGLTRSHGGQREDLASAFMREGAEAVIASALPVFDRMGKFFGQMLYDEEYHNDKGMAYTFADVRRALEKEYRGHRIWPAWSLLTYHGNPYAHLPHV